MVVLNNRIVAGCLVGLGLILSANSAAARDHIQVTGSSTVYPFASVVAETLGKSGKFKTPVVESNGTGAGIAAFCASVATSTPDIADASRPMTPAERARCRANGVGDIAEIKIGFDGIILAGDAHQPGFNVTQEQLWRAVAKRVPVAGRWVNNPYKNWSDIDKRLPNRPLSVFGPGPNHGTRDAFMELVVEPICLSLPEAKLLPEATRGQVCGQIRDDGVWINVTEDYALVVGKLSANPTAMAIFTYAYLEANRDKLRAATIDGLAASPESIADGRYPISRTLYVYVKKAHIAVIPGLTEFLGEFVSERAAGEEGYLTDKGLVPLPTAARAQQRALVRSLSVPAAPTTTAASR